MADNKTQYLNINGAREEEQKELMKEIREADHCPFCMENFRKYNQDEPIKDGKYWLVTKNRWPYKNTKYHFLLIYKEHGVCLSDLKPEAAGEYFTFLKELEKEYQIKGGAVSMRFGDTDWSAGTVNHLHAQFIVPDIEKEDFEPVKVKVGLQWEKRTK